MDSVPPATTIEALPVMMVCAPRMMAFSADAQTLLTVVHTTLSGRPAPMAHWRAGAWPRLGRGRSGQLSVGVCVCVYVFPGGWIQLMRGLCGTYLADRTLP